MMGCLQRAVLFVVVLSVFGSSRAAGRQTGVPGTAEGDLVVKDFKFHSGESLPELRLHYTTLGKLVRDAKGRVTNAVLILHGTGGAGQQFLREITIRRRNSRRLQHKSCTLIPRTISLIRPS